MQRTLNFNKTISLLVNKSFGYGTLPQGNLSKEKLRNIKISWWREWLQKSLLSKQLPSKALFNNPSWGYRDCLVVKNS